MRYTETDYSNYLNLLLNQLQNISNRFRGVAATKDMETEFHRSIDALLQNGIDLGYIEALEGVVVGHFSYRATVWLTQRDEMGYAVSLNLTIQGDHD